MSSVIEANTVYQLILTPIPLCQNSIKKPYNTIYTKTHINKHQINEYQNIMHDR